MVVIYTGVGDWWLVANEDANSVQSHKTFVIQRCSTLISFKHENNIYKIPVAIKSLTMYSDGLKEHVNLTIPDGKRQLLMGMNPLTQKIRLMFRIMINKNTVFKTTHMDDFSNENVLTISIQQDRFIPLDDIENNIAHNDEETEEIPIGEIEGSEYIYLGSTEEYTFNQEVLWTISSIDNCLNIISTDNGVCIVESTSNLKYIGNVGILTVLNLDGNILATKNIIIKGMF